MLHYQAVFPCLLYTSKMKKILSTRVLVKICVLTTILLVLIIYTIWGNSALMVSMVNISSDRIASAFSNFRIAQVSDLHNAEFGESNTELIELLSEHEPDIIVITGDLIDAGHTDKMCIRDRLHCGSPIQYANINSSYWQTHLYAFGRL